MKTNLIVLLLLALASCGQTSEKKEIVAEKEKQELKKIDGWNMLDEAAYSIQYPADWEENKSGQMGTSFILLAPTDSEEDNFRENVNLVKQDLSGSGHNLDSYTELSEKQIKEMLGVTSFIENKRIKSTNGDYHKMVYAGDQGNYHLVFEQYCRVINDQAYVLTLTSEEDQYKSTKKTGEKILNSFVLK